MILTGHEIEDQIAAQRILIDPYNPELVGPNSVDVHLAREFLYYTKWGGVLDMKKQNPTASMIAGDEGLILNPGVLYLCCTVEWIETDHYVVAVGGRSSVARLGIAVHQTAPFGHMGWKGRLTLEVSVIEPVRVYVDKPICQLFFMTTVGKPRLYDGPHQNQKTALPSMFWK